MLDIVVIYSLTCVNDGVGPNAWTFCSSLGVGRRLNFVIHNSNIALVDRSPTKQLDLGSDHRAVHAKVCLASTKRNSNRKT